MQYEYGNFIMMIILMSGTDRPRRFLDLLACFRGAAGSGKVAPT